MYNINAAVLIKPSIFWLYDTFTPLLYVIADDKVCISFCNVFHHICAKDCFKFVLKCCFSQVLLSWTYDWNVMVKHPCQRFDSNSHITLDQKNSMKNTLLVKQEICVETWYLLVANINTKIRICRFRMKMDSRKKWGLCTSVCICIRYVNGSLLGRIQLWIKRRRSTFR